MEPNPLQPSQSRAPEAPQPSLNNKQDPYREPVELAHNNTIPLPVEPVLQKQTTPSQVPPAPQAPAIEEKTSPLVGKKSEQRKVGELPKLRTYEADVAEAIERQKASVLQIAMAEQKKKGEDRITYDSTPKTGPRKLIVVASIVLILAGIVSVAGVYLYIQYGSLIPAEDDARTIVVTSDSEAEIVISGISATEATDRISNEISTTAENTIKHIAFFTQQGTQREPVRPLDIFTFFDISAPALLLRSLGNTFTYGVHGVAGGQPFIIVDISSFETVFAGMLEWEFVMDEELRTILNIETQAPRKEVFEDIVIRNNDTRMLRSETGEIILVYAFPSRNRLIITTNETTLAELFTRLSAAAKVRR